MDRRNAKKREARARAKVEKESEAIFFFLGLFCRPVRTEPFFPCQAHGAWLDAIAKARVRKAARRQADKSSRDNLLAVHKAHRGIMPKEAVYHHTGPGQAAGLVHPYKGPPTLDREDARVRENQRVTHIRGSAKTYSTELIAGPQHAWNLTPVDDHTWNDVRNLYSTA